MFFLFISFFLLFISGIRLKVKKNLNLKCTVVTLIESSFILQTANNNCHNIGETMHKENFQWSANCLIISLSICKLFYHFKTIQKSSFQLTLWIINTQSIIYAHSVCQYILRIWASCHFSHRSHSLSSDKTSTPTYINHFYFHRDSEFLHFSCLTKFAYITLPERMKATGPVWAASKWELYVFMYLAWQIRSTFFEIHWCVGCCFVTFASYYWDKLDFLPQNYSGRHWGGT